MPVIDERSPNFDYGNEGYYYRKSTFLKDTAKIFVGGLPYSTSDDFANNHLAKSRRGEHPPYLPARRGTLSGTDNPVIPATRQEDRSRVEVNVFSPTIEYSPIQSIERPDIPPNYSEGKYQSCPGQSPPVFKSTLPRHEERVSVVLNSPPQDHPLPPPRIKPSVTTDITEKSREELEQKRQVDALILNLKTELANVKTEREEIQTKLGEEVRTWKNNHTYVCQLCEKVERDNVSLKKVVAQLIKDYTSAANELQDAVTNKKKWEEEVKEDGKNNIRSLTRSVQEMSIRTRKRRCSDPDTPGSPSQPSYPVAKELLLKKNENNINILISETISVYMCQPSAYSDRNIHESSNNQEVLLAKEKIKRVIEAQHADLKGKFDRIRQSLSEKEEKVHQDLDEILIARLHELDMCARNINLLNETYNLNQPKLGTNTLGDVNFKILTTVTASIEEFRKKIDAELNIRILWGSHDIEHSIRNICTLSYKSDPLATQTTVYLPSEGAVIPRATEHTSTDRNNSLDHNSLFLCTQYDKSFSTLHELENHQRERHSIGIITSPYRRNSVHRECILERQQQPYAAMSKFCPDSEKTSPPQSIQPYHESTASTQLHQQGVQHYDTTTTQSPSQGSQLLDNLMNQGIPYSPQAQLQPNLPSPLQYIPPQHQAVNKISPLIKSVQEISIRTRKGSVRILASIQRRRATHQGEIGRVIEGQHADLNAKFDRIRQSPSEKEEKVTSVQRRSVKRANAPVGWTRIDGAIRPYIPEDYSQALEGELFRQIHFLPKQKPTTPAGRDLISSSNHQIAPYVQEGPTNQLFETSNIQSGLFHPKVAHYTISAPLSHTTTPFGYSQSSQMQYAPRASPSPPPPPSEPGQLPFKPTHTPITRHASDSRFRDIEIRSPPSYTVDTNSPTNPLIQPKLFPRTNFRKSHQPEAELIQQHHEVPYTRSQPRDIMKGDKFEVKLVWQKQQPTLETDLEYFDMKDTEPPITLRWEYRKELSIASARLSAGEHRGSLAIPDSDAVVYGVQP
ncbi:hypothetical protein LOD99_9541 [Oopsacas minuta]|uniref:Uncharacterized protein n=1 Tax=Oopsacas minuta TaxID=111878 RepID=A0AAV7JBH7_9METZ|nr:hypothetical protein LOD99_9541 [Oopsacas minuta]